MKPLASAPCLFVLLVEQLCRAFCHQRFNLLFKFRIAHAVCEREWLEPLINVVSGDAPRASAGLLSVEPGAPLRTSCPYRRIRPTPERVPKL